jgi:hypothetical protein
MQRSSLAVHHPAAYYHFRCPGVAWTGLPSSRDPSFASSSLVGCWTGANLDQTGQHRMESPPLPHRSQAWPVSWTLFSKMSGWMGPASLRQPSGPLRLELSWLQPLPLVSTEGTSATTLLLSIECPECNSRRNLQARQQERRHQNRHSRRSRP